MKNRDHDYMKKFHDNQAGNVFIFILLGIVLFAALGFVVARGMRSETTSAMSQREAELAAVDILSYAQKLERAVSKLRARGISENNIDFTNPVVNGYAYSSPQANSFQIFKKEGGGVTWQNPVARANDNSPWLFTGQTCIVDIGTGGTGCDSDSVSNEELLAVLPKLSALVCAEINKRLGITSLPTGGAVSNSKFTGTYSDNASPSNTAGRTAACFEDASGDKNFYYVLIAR